MTGMTIQATFGVDVTPLQRGLAQAEQAAKASASKVSSALNSVQATAEKIGRRPTFRPFGQQQFDDFAARQGPRTAASFRPAPRGKYPTPTDEGEASAFRGVAGLGRGLGLLAGISELANWYERVNEEAFKLQAAISKLTQNKGSAAFRDKGSIQNNLSGITETMNQLRERDMTELQGGERSPFMTLGHIVRRLRQGATGDTNANEEQQKDRLRKQAIQSIDDLASKQRDLNDATAGGSERDMALMKEQISHREKLGELAEIEAATGVHNKAARDQENQRTELANKLIEDAADQRQRELTIAARTAALATSMLTPEQQRVQILKEQIEAIDEQLSKSRLLTQEQKTNLQTQRAGTQNELYRAQYANRFDGDAISTPEKQAQANFASWVKSQSPSNPNAYKTHPDAYSRSPDAYNGPGDDWTQGRTFRSQLDGFKRHMDAPGHMKDFEGSDSFNDFFHNGNAGAGGAATNALGAPGVLNSIDKKLDGIGANR